VTATANNVQLVLADDPGADLTLLLLLLLLLFVAATADNVQLGLGKRT
jgi:hypothetical protein